MFENVVKFFFVADLVLPIYILDLDFRGNDEFWVNVVPVRVGRLVTKAVFLK